MLNVIFVVEKDKEKVKFGSVLDGVYALGKVHMRSGPSLGTFPNDAFVSAIKVTLNELRGQKLEKQSPWQYVKHAMYIITDSRPEKRTIFDSSEFSAEVTVVCIPGNSSGTDLKLEIWTEIWFRFEAA